MTLRENNRKQQNQIAGLPTQSTENYASIEFSISMNLCKPYTRYDHVKYNSQDS